MTSAWSETMPTGSTVTALCVGLSVSEAAKLCNYMHLRKAENFVVKTAFQRANYDKSLDFMDCLDDDCPKGLLCPVHADTTRRSCLCRVWRG